MASIRKNLILGEFRRVLDDRYRLSVPAELMTGRFAAEGAAEGPAETMALRETAGGEPTVDLSGLEGESGRRPQAVLAKERPGCVSLWPEGVWQEHLELGIQVVESKLQAGRLGDRLAQVQTLGRLLSTRHRTVPLAGRGRLVIPEGFREFLGVEPGSEVLVLGAAVCIEIWNPKAWKDCLKEDIPRFASLLDELSG